MQGISLQSGVVLICGAACVVVAGLAVLTFVSMLSSRSSGETAERAAACAISVVAFGVSWVVFWGSTGGLEQLGGPLAWLSVAIAQGLGSVGAPGGLFQIQASIAAVVIAYFAWRYSNR